MKGNSKFIVPLDTNYCSLASYRAIVDVSENRKLVITLISVNNYEISKSEFKAIAYTFELNEKKQECKCNFKISYVES